jgi:hypothetical protein
MSTLLALLVLYIVFRGVMKGTFLGKTIKLLWKIFIELTKVLYYGCNGVYKYLCKINKKIHPTEEDAEDKDDSKTIPFPKTNASK